MHPIPRILAMALMMSCAPATFAAAPRPDAIDLAARACPAADDLPRDATCLRATVPEDYDKPAGRAIGLDIVLLRAKHREAHGAPLFVFQGGPGDRTTLSADDGSAVWATFRDTHDLVFVDQRGNGDTPDLSCKAETLAAASRAIDLFPAAPLAACAHRLVPGVDLARYTTTDAARDVDNVRAALGYVQIDIVGYSYGTRLAQEVLRRDAAAVHAMLLIGPESPALAVPAGMAPAAQQSLAGIVARCKADAACAAAWPDIDGDLARLQQRLDHGAFPASASAGRPGTVIGAGIVASYLRSHLYSASAAATLPRRIHALSDAHRDQAELAEIGAWRAGFDAWLPMGMYMAITCAEDLPFVDVDAERRLAEGTFLGSYRVDQQAAACRAWSRTPPNAAVHAPVVSSVPTLLLVGEFDPATPPSLAPGLVASLAHGRTIVVPNRGHDVSEEWNACLEKVSTSFLETADEAHLDVSCVGRLRMPSFDTTRVPPN